MRPTNRVRCASVKQLDSGVCGCPDWGCVDRPSFVSGKGRRPASASRGRSRSTPRSAGDTEDRGTRNRSGAPGIAAWDRPGAPRIAEQNRLNSFAGKTVASPTRDSFRECWFRGPGRSRTRWVRGTGEGTTRAPMAWMTNPGGDAGCEAEACSPGPATEERREARPGDSRRDGQCASGSGSDGARCASMRTNESTDFPFMATGCVEHDEFVSGIDRAVSMHGGPLGTRAIERPMVSRTSARTSKSARCAWASEGILTKGAFAG